MTSSIDDVILRLNSKGHLGITHIKFFAHMVFVPKGYLSLYAF